MFSLEFDPRSLEALAHLAEFDILLAGSVQAALSHAGDILVQSAVMNTWERFANPTGALAGSIVAVRDNPYTVEVGSDSPYAARREYGFSGQTDSLGRYYANDPGVFYLTDALITHEEIIGQLMAFEIDGALRRLGGA